MSALIRLFHEPSFQRFGWVLVHFIWQGAAVGLLLAVMLRIMGRASSHLRYLVICAALLACGVAPVATWVALGNKTASPPVVSEPAANFTTLPAIQNGSSGSHEMDEGDNLYSAFRPATPGTPAIKTIVKYKTATPWRTVALQILGQSLPYAISLWFAGVLVLTFRLVFGWMQLQSLRRSGTAVPDFAWQEKFLRLAEQMHVCVPVCLLQSALVEVPTLIGLLRPVILLPASVFTGLTSGQLEAILAHELAHVRRCDYLVNLFQTAIETILFYHPAVWWISRKLREERENCCDDIAMETIRDRAAYAGALAALEESRGAFQPLAMAASGAPLRRIRRIAGVDRRKSSLAPIMATLLVAGCMLALLGGRIASGQDSGEIQKSKRQSTPTAQNGDVPAPQKPEEQEAPVNQLVLELSDGSRIVGAPVVDKFKLTTKYAELEIQLSLMRSVEFRGKDRVALMSLRNGDLLSGQLAATEIEVKTVFGQAVIPMANVNKIRMGHTGIGKALPEDGLVLHYTFDTDEDGKVTDASGNGNNGTLSGATYVNEGKLGGAMSFAGNGKGIIIKSAASLQMQDFTVMAWIKRGDLEKVSYTGEGSVLFGYGQAGYGVGIDHAGHIGVSKIGYSGVKSSSMITDGAFHHIAFTKKGNKVTLYIDGAADPVIEYDINFEFTTDLGVGVRPDNKDNGFIGVMDEVSVYNRALSDDEVKGVYESQK